MSDLLRFLARTRTLSDVADHYKISVKQAEERVLKEIDSGRIILEPVKPRLRAERFLKLGEKVKPKSVRDSRPSQMGRLPKVQPHKLYVRTVETKRIPRFRFVESSISHLTRPSTIFETINDTKIGRPSNVRLPLEKQFQLLQDLVNGPRHAGELKRLLGIPRLNLSRFVKNGLVQTTWGPSGVGVYYEITGKGHRELKRLKAALARNDSMSRKNLIHLKHVTAYISG